METAETTTLTYLHNNADTRSGGGKCGEGLGNRIFFAIFALAILLTNKTHTVR